MDCWEFLSSKPRWLRGDCGGSFIEVELARFEGVGGRDPSVTCAKSLRPSGVGRGLLEPADVFTRSPEETWPASAVEFASVASVVLASGLTLLTKSGRGMLRIYKSKMEVK